MIKSNNNQLNKNDNYNRISSELSLLLSPAADVSMAILAEKLEIPIKIIRNDIRIIAKYSDLIEMDAAEIEKINSGIIDNKSLTASPEVLLEEDTYILPIEQMEYPYMRGWLGKKEHSFRIISTYEKFPEKIKDKVRMLDNAVKQRKQIYYNYHVAQTGQNLYFRRSKPIMVRVSPEDPENAKCITEKGIILTIANMDTLAVEGDRDYVSGEITDQVDEIIDVDWEKVWGYPNPGETEPFHVKIEIMAYGNIKKKIENAISERCTTEKKFECIEDNRYIYEDDIIGETGFRMWLRSFGSSVKVIEPKWLADKILEDYDVMKKQYELGKFI